MSEVGEISRAIPSTPVKGEVVPEYGGVNLEKESRFPFRKVVPPEIPTFSLVWLPENDIGKDEFNKGVFELRQPSRHHARASEVVLGEGVRPGVIWGDENGILFGAVNIKGNNLEDPRVERDEYSPTGFRVRGLQEGTDVERVVRVSKILRAAGVDTEKVEMVIKPQELIINGQKVGIPEFKRLLIDKAREEALKPRPEGYGQRRSPYPEDLALIEEDIEQREFYFTVRGLQVSERFRDLDIILNEQSFKDVMGRVFAFVNARERIEAARQGKEPRILDVTRDEDVEYYFTGYLPRRLARNIARMHREGLVHGFLTSHNMSLAGSIYDLDVVKGDVLGDKDTRANDFRRDNNEALSGLANVFLKPSGELILQRFPPARIPYFGKELGGRFADSFFRTFAKTYFEEMGASLDFSVSAIEEQQLAYIDKAIAEGRQAGLSSQTLLTELEAGEATGESGVGELRRDLDKKMRTAYSEFLDPYRGRDYFGLDVEMERVVENAIREGFEQVVGQKIASVLREITPEFYQSLRAKIIEKIKSMDKIPA